MTENATPMAAADWIPQAALASRKFPLLLTMDERSICALRRRPTTALACCIFAARRRR